VLDPAGDDEELAGVEFDIAVVQLNCQVAVQDEEEVLRLVVLVPDEFALDFDDAMSLSL
jgi:hypothetical protein